jgi:hypothetical protein
VLPLKMIALVAVASLFCATQLRAQTSATDRQANIVRAAEDIARIQHDKGSDGAFAAIDQCYRRELAQAQSLTPGLETCMTQDIIVSRISAQFMESLSTNWRTVPGAMDPDELRSEMGKRVTGVFDKFHATKADLVAFNVVVSNLGMTAYGHAVFPDKFPTPNPVK